MLQMLVLTTEHFKDLMDIPIPMAVGVLGDAIGTWVGRDIDIVRSLNEKYQRIFTHPHALILCPST